MSDRCRTCDRPVVWARNDKTGKAAPIDATPDPAGNITLLPAGRYHVRRNDDPVMDVLLDAATYTSHWQTCPDRDAWKKGTAR